MKNHIKKQLLGVALVSAFGVAGCAGVSAAGTTVTIMVNSYCKADELGRVLLREKFARLTYPHRIEVTCDGDVLKGG